MYAERGAAGEQVIDDAQRGAAQAIGIGAAGGNCAHSKKPDQAIKFVCQAQGKTGRRCRIGITSSTGQIVFANGLRNLRRFAAGLRVDSTHDAL